MNKSIIYYTDNRLDPKIASPVREQLRSIGLPIVSASLEPLHNMGRNVVLNEPRGYLTMFRQILAALEATANEIVFFCEHDVLYPKSHFDYTPERTDTFYYDLNWWKIGKGNLAVHWDAVQVSGLVCYRDLALKFYASRVASFDPDNFDRKFEPTVDTEFKTWWAPDPHVDIRHTGNLTYNKWKLEHFRKKETAVNFQETTIDKIPYWNIMQLESLINKKETT
jgi:hypothetical protein